MFRMLPSHALVDYFVMQMFKWRRCFSLAQTGADTDTGSYAQTGPDSVRARRWPP